MSHPALTKNASVRLPTNVIDTTGKAGVYRIAVSTTAASYALPTGMVGNFVKIYASGTDIQCGFSRGAVTIVVNQASALGTGHAAAGATVPNGMFIDGLVPKNSTYFNVLGIGSGFVELYLSEALNIGTGFTG